MIQTTESVNKLKKKAENLKSGRKLTTRSDDDIDAV